MTGGESTTRGYRATMTACAPIIRGWGRLEVTGLEYLPTSGPVLVAANHDSYWDPVAVGVAALGRRQIRALAKDALWKVPGLDRILDSMGQIPIRRGERDEAAMARAIEELRAGACIGIFPEATRSLGRTLRARSGLGRLAAAVPEAQLVACAVTGTVDVPRFPKRPEIRVEFFHPVAAGRQDGEAPGELGLRVLTEIRARAPIAAAGRRAVV